MLAARRMFMPKGRPIRIVERFHTLHPLPVVATAVVGDHYFVRYSGMYCVEALVGSLVPPREIVPCGEKERGDRRGVDDEAGAICDGNSLKTKLQPEGLDREEPTNVARDRIAKRRESHQLRPLSVLALLANTEGIPYPCCARKAALGAGFPSLLPFLPYFGAACEA